MPWYVSVDLYLDPNFVSLVEYFYASHSITTFLLGAYSVVKQGAKLLFFDKVESRKKN